VAALDDLAGQPGGPPVLTVDAAGLLEVRWPMGRPARVDMATVVFEQLIDDANAGRRALNVLGDVAAALAKLTG
jgi:hypothetical protein